MHKYGPWRKESGGGGGKRRNVLAKALGYLKEALHTGGACRQLFNDYLPRLCHAWGISIADPQAAETVVLAVLTTIGTTMGMIGESKRWMAGHDVGKRVVRSRLGLRLLVELSLTLQNTNPFVGETSNALSLSEINKLCKRSGQLVTNYLLHTESLFLLENLRYRNSGVFADTTETASAKRGKVNRRWKSGCGGGLRGRLGIGWGY